MTTRRPDTAYASPRPHGDTLLLALLVFAVLQITGLAEASVLPTRIADVLRHPVLGDLFPAAGEAAMGDIGPRPGDPVGLVLNALSLGFLLAYLLVDLVPWFRWRDTAKWVLLSAIILSALFLPAAKLILLRQQSGPASYTHDGGVIQTEATIEFTLAGKNPYREDYVDTPMAEWGFDKYRTALYHYPYLPWTFLFSTPLYLAGNALGAYDQRIVYLLLLGGTLLVAHRLAADSRRRMALVALLALNPIMALDVIFGQNDVFVLAWIVFSLAAWQMWSSRLAAGRPARLYLVTSTVCYGLACASKPTAWFFAPFYLLLLVVDQLAPQDSSPIPPARKRWRTLWGNGMRAIPVVLKRVWPAAMVFLLVLLPYVVWDAGALYDDVWRWSSGQGETGYQIWGWGASNFVLAFGLVPDRFSLWPFWIVEVVLALPVLLWFLTRQLRHNTLANAAWHYAIFLLTFFYGSRFLNENYLGYILAFLAIGYLSQTSYSSSGGSTPTPD